MSKQSDNLDMMVAIEQRWDQQHDAQLLLTVGAVMLAMKRRMGDRNGTIAIARISVDDIASMVKSHMVTRDFDSATREWIYTVKPRSEEVTSKDNEQ